MHTLYLLDLLETLVLSMLNLTKLLDRTTSLLEPCHFFRVDLEFSLEIADDFSLNKEFSHRLLVFLVSLLNFLRDRDEARELLSLCVELLL